MPLPRMLPVVAIVGRPNVGKSTLFNRMMGRRYAVVHPTPGVTRDRQYGEATYAGRDFFLVDTGGYEPEDVDRLRVQMREQTQMAVQEADVVVFLGDVNEANNPADDEILNMLRRSGKTILIAVNKCDSARSENSAWEFSRFGFDRLFPVSALHGEGVLDLLDAILDALPEEIAPEAETVRDPTIRVAIVGRQNVGKSTLLNRMVGEERVIANPLPGTTRDAIDTFVEREGRRYCLIDTAGIRRRGSIERGIEHLSVLSSAFALRRCHVALLVIDAAQGINQQDAHIGGLIHEEGKPCIIVINKWDAVEKENETYGAFIKKAKDDFKFLPSALYVTISALTGQRCHRLWEMIDLCASEARRRVPTGELNRVVHDAFMRNPPAVFRNRQLKAKYATQAETEPPTFVLFVNDPGLAHFSYRRYLLNRLREAFGFQGAPIRLILRRKSPPGGWEEHLRAASETGEMAPDPAENRYIPFGGVVPVQEEGDVTVDEADEDEGEDGAEI